MTWCQKTVFGYSPVVSITSFTKSFKDGLAFNFILHKHKPNLFDIDMVSYPHWKLLGNSFSVFSPPFSLQILSKSPLSRLDFAFQMYHQHFGLARLLDPEDVHLESVDKQSVMTYIMCIYQVMPHKDDEERIMVRNIFIGIGSILYFAKTSNISLKEAKQKLFGVQMSKSCHN